MKLPDTARLPLFLAALVFSCALPALASEDHHHHGEEAHHHDVVGTIRALAGEQLDLETAKGKIESFQLSNATEIKRGDAPAKREDLKVGVRVVVMSEERAGKDVVVEVNLNAVAHEGHED